VLGLRTADFQQTAQRRDSQDSCHVSKRCYVKGPTCFASVTIRGNATVMHSFVRAYSHAAPSHAADEEMTSMCPAPVLATGDPRPLTDSCVVSPSPHNESSLILGSSNSVRSFKLASHGSSESMRLLASQTSLDSDNKPGSLYLRSKNDLVLSCVLSPLAPDTRALLV